MTAIVAAIIAAVVTARVTAVVRARARALGTTNLKPKFGARTVLPTTVMMIYEEFQVCLKYLITVITYAATVFTVSSIYTCVDCV
jgi:hypothetical protein